MDNQALIYPSGNHFDCNLNGNSLLIGIFCLDSGQINSKSVQLKSKPGVGHKIADLLLGQAAPDEKGRYKCPVFQFDISAQFKSVELDA